MRMFMYMNFVGRSAEDFRFYDHLAETRCDHLHSPVEQSGVIDSAESC